MREESTSANRKPKTVAAAGEQPSKRAAPRRLDPPERLAVDLPFIGAVRLPAPQQLAFYCAVTALVALEIIEWPVALLITAGHALTQQQHNKSLEDLGEVLEHLV